MKLKRTITIFAVGYLAHMALVEHFFADKMIREDNCEPTRKEDGSLDLDIGDCMQEIENELPSIFVSPRLYRFLKYKHIQVLR